MKNKQYNIREKKINISKSRLFILLNIVFLVGCCILYGGRLIYYYRIENPRIKQNETLLNIIKLKKNIVTIGDGLYKTNNGYTYKGKNINNYVKYSSRIWRIVSVTDEGVKLITDDSQTSLVWGIKSTYDKSLVNSWLNNKDNNIKSFYESLSNPSILTTTKTCIDVIEEDNITCDKYINENVGLLSAYEYQQAGGENSYLNIGQYWWTSSINSNRVAWYVYSKGTLNNTVSSGKTYYAYGVRPTITIKGDTKVINGRGSSDDPYNLDTTTSNILNDKYVGDYIKYNNYIWRIIETDDNYVKVVMNETIKNNNQDYYTSYGKSNYMSTTEGIGLYLNNTFYKSLNNKEYILNHDFNMGRYDKTNNYDFNKLTEYTEKMHVGLLQLGELFITDIDNYFLSTRTITSDGTIYEVIEDGKIYAGSTSDKQRVRPSIYLKPDIVVNSGSGTVNDPYMIG